jgi:hypothetical protein
MRDPRSHRRYIALRAQWLPTQAGRDCCLCGRPVDVALPGMSRWGPTVEHRIPVRVILRTAASWDHAVAMCCDVTTWDIAHRHCQSRQGGRAGADATNGKPANVPSRDW